MPAWAPVMVAGGLTPVNVGSAIRALHPLAVDVSTGVEERVRHKDRMKLNAFVAAVRAADALEGR
jgi:phosphoribosylanthranilate isomerase